MPGAYAPIQETQVGAIAYLWGIMNNGQPISMLGIASFELDSDDLTSTWTEKKKTDTSGYTQNITQYEQLFERDIKFNPSGATRAAAAAVIDATVALATLTIANHKVAAYNGTWRIKPGTKINLKMADDAAISIPCERYLNANQNAALTGAPIVG